MAVADFTELGPMCPLGQHRFADGAGRQSIWCVRCGKHLARDSRHLDGVTYIRDRFGIWRPTARHTAGPRARSNVRWWNEEMRGDRSWTDEAQYMGMDWGDGPSYSATHEYGRPPTGPVRPFFR